MLKPYLDFSWRGSLFIGVQYRCIAFIIDGMFTAYPGFVIGLGWFELFIGIEVRRSE